MQVADYPDLDEPEGKTGYCARCERNVQSIPVDYGFGYEFGSIHSVHHDIQDTCPDCGEEITTLKS